MTWVIVQARMLRAGLGAVMEEDDSLSGSCASRAPGLPDALRWVRLEEAGKRAAAFVPFPSFPCSGMRIVYMASG